MRRLLAAFLVSISTVAGASSATTDFTDLWWNPNESGWGMNVIQQKEVMFITLFVYGPNNTAVWYVAPATTFQGGTQLPFRFTGPLYQTTGPWFGAPVFNPNSVTNREVGTLTFTTSQIASAQVSYTVDGVAVNKTVQRQTWRVEDLSGTYVGAMFGNWSGCAANNGPFAASPTFTITQSATTLTLREVGNGYECTYTGPYTQQGKLGTFSGTGSCSDLTGGMLQFVGSEMQVNLQGFTARFGFNFGNCQFSGRIGGVRQ